jgi:lactate 2-monooxygenase
MKKFSGPERELEIYRGALMGKTLAAPLPLASLEARAREVLEARAYDYVAGGAGGERTMRANLEAFDRRPLVPRMLRNVSERDLSVKLLGMDLPAPVLLAPIGVLGIIHSEADLAVARAAASLDVPFCQSTVSSYAIEEVAQAAGAGRRWFQLYWGKSRELTASMVARAERAGFGAVVVTLDTHLLGWRERDLDRGYLPFMLAEGLANYVSDPTFQAMIAGVPEAQRKMAAVQTWGNIFSNSALTWSDLGFLREHTRLPIVLKGILHPDDARRALDAGADAVVVSNHGGRQVDGAIASLDALPEVARAVAGRVPVLFDSGIRRGSDVCKAIALGATAVLLGRPYVYGLAVAGEAGVREVLLNLIADFDLTLALAGCRSCAELTPEVLGG